MKASDFGLGFDPKGLRAVAYGRVSTNSTDQKNSLKNQVEFWSDFFKEQDHEVAECGVFYQKNGNKSFTQGIYADEGITGTSLKRRHAFKEMYSDGMKRKFDIIYTKSVARFARSVEDATKVIKDLKSVGIGVYFLNENIFSLDQNKEFILNIYISQAQEESRNKSSITQFGMRKAQKEGKFTGSVAPYGYNLVDGFLRINPEEAEVVKEIFDLYLNRGHGNKGIASILHQKGIPTRKGGNWLGITVSHILENPIYTGKQVQHKTQVIDVNRGLRKSIPKEEQLVAYFDNLRIINDNTFQEVQDEKTKRKQRWGEIQIKSWKEADGDGEQKELFFKDVVTNGSRYSNAHLFSNLVYCSICGGSFKRKKMWKSEKYEWVCSVYDAYGKSRCSQRNAYSEEYLLEKVKREIVEQRSEEKGFRGNLNYYIHTYHDTRGLEQKLEEVRNSIENLENEIENNIQLLTKGLIGEDRFKARNDRLELELKAEKSELNKLMFAEQTIAEVRKKYESFEKYFFSVDIENLTNVILKKIIARITAVYVDYWEESNLDSPKQILIDWNFLDKTTEEIMDDMVRKDMEEYERLKEQGLLENWLK